MYDTSALKICCFYIIVRAKIGKTNNFELRHCSCQRVLLIIYVLYLLYIRFIHLLYYNEHIFTIFREISN